MSETPETDAFVETLSEPAYSDRARFMHMQGHSRTLERRLAAVTADLQTELRKSNLAHSALGVEVNAEQIAISPLAGAVQFLRQRLAAVTAQSDEAKRNCDYNWGEANYRLKYMSCIGRALGRDYRDGDDPRNYAQECAAIAESLRQQLTQAQATVEKMAKWIRYNSDRCAGDHACIECFPHEPMVIPGFQCAVHAARATATPRQQSICYEIVGRCTGEVIGVCTDEGRKDIEAEEPGSTFNVITREAFESYGDDPWTVPGEHSPRQQPEGTT